MSDNRGASQGQTLLTLAEVAAYLKVAEKTVLRMLRRGELPAVKIANQWRFSRDALNDWLMGGMRSAATEALQELRPATVVPQSLSRLIPDGCILTDLAPEPKEAVFARLAAPLMRAGLVVDAQRFVGQLMDREALLSTAVGEGIALPHARAPSAPNGRNGIAIGIAPGGIDFQAPDGRPVRIIVIVCADSVPHHLEMMVQVALALREGLVVQALRDARAPCDVLAALIEHDQRRLFSRLAGRNLAAGGASEPESSPGNPRGSQP